VVGYQASARGGVVRLKMEKDRVILTGQAKTIFTGHVLV